MSNKRLHGARTAVLALFNTSMDDTELVETTRYVSELINNYDAVPCCVKCGYSEVEADQLVCEKFEAICIPWYICPYYTSTPHVSGSKPEEHTLSDSQVLEHIENESDFHLKVTSEHREKLQLLTDPIDYVKELIFLARSYLEN